MAGERATESKRLRGWMMRTLDKAYPNGVENNDLTLALQPVFPEVAPSRIEVEIVYLEEKGYVNQTRAQVLGEDVCITRLTVKGKDLVERSIATDPGVLLPGSST